MIKNQRPYQLMLAKTHSDLISTVTAIGAKAVGVTVGALASVARGEKIDVHADSARRELQAIFPKPQGGEAIPPLPPLDSKVDISVIIPAYNAEKYIVDCLDSILGQKTAYSLEIIVVNDCSTDQTLARLASYRNDARVQIIDFANGGSAAKARNEGLLHAKGAHLLFVDSDDILPDGAIEALMRGMARYDADIVQGGWQYMDESGALGATQRYVECAYTDKRRMDRFDLPGMPWGKLYRRKLFEEIRFPAEYSCFEDTIIHFLLFRTAPCVASIGDTVYRWRRNPSGITQTSQSHTKAIQSYWIVEEMRSRDAALHLPHDAMFSLCLIGQLSNFCYANVAKMDVEMQKKIFALCCECYDAAMTEAAEGEPEAVPLKKLPYAVQFGARALREKRFDLWVRQGRLYQLIR